MLQIKSVDYVDQHGKEYESSRLPGYAGVSGLDVDPAVLARQKAEETGQDNETVRSLSLCNLLASLHAYLAWTYLAHSQFMLALHMHAC